MTPLILDFETYWSKDYSLAKMPTMQYVRDSRFECLGVATGAVDTDASDRWFAGHQTTADALALKGPWNQIIAIAHNAAFDGAVLMHHFGHRPALWIDTHGWVRWAIGQGYAPPEASTSLKWWGEYLGLAKGDTAEATGAGGEVLKDYAVRDIQITRKLLHWLQANAPWPEDELKFSDLHVRMATEPVLGLDRSVLEPELAPPPPEAEALRSRDTFAAALKAFGITPGTKTSAANGKQTYAFAKTDAFMQSLAAHENPAVRMLHKLKTEGASNIRRTRAERMLTLGAPMPMPQGYYGTHTGRSNGLDKINVLNLPQGGFRSALVAPKGKKLLVADYSQIEARVVARGAQDDYSLQIFRSGEDPYKVVASEELFHVPLHKVTPEQRQRAKPVVLALGFAQSANGFVEYCRSFGIQMDPREAARIVAQYRRLRPKQVEFWERLMSEITSTGQLVLPSGRLLTYPDLTRRGREVTFQRPRAFSKRKGRDTINLWRGIAVENWTQATARDLFMHAVVRLPSDLTPVLLPYDEIVAVGTPDQAEAMRATMLDAPEWAEGLPVAVGKVEIVDNYGEAK